MALGSKMKEEELKYMLRLLDEIDEEIFEEILQVYYDIEESNKPKQLTDQAYNFLKVNLRSNPVTTITLINFIQDNFPNVMNTDKIQTFYFEVLKAELKENSCSDKLITLISLVRWEDKYLPQFSQQILMPLTEDSFRQFRKQILLSLILHKKPQLLNVVSDQMQKNEPQTEFKLTPEYMLELCYQDKTHWLLKAAQVYKHQLNDLKTVTFKINNFTKQILIMVLIDLTNSPETYDLPSLINQLTNIFSILDTYTKADEHLHFYLTEVKRELTIIKFCLDNNSKIMTTSIFSQVLTQSSLAVMSQVCRLSKIDRYKVSRLLNTNNEFVKELMMLHDKENEASIETENKTNWEVVTYNTYCAITKIIDTILSLSEGSDETQDTTSSLDEIKRLVLSIYPLEYCIEAIENIFACLFLRYEYFSCYEHNQEFPCGTHSECSYFYSKKQTPNPNNIKSNSTGFMCNSLTTQLVLNTLKLCLEKMEDNAGPDIDQDLMSRLKHMVKVVNHSVWKLQLVSTLSPDPSPVQLKLCLDYVEVDESSEDDEREIDVKTLRKKPKARRRHTNNKYDADHMLASTISANDDAFITTKGNIIDFISIMLAKPNCLVALALYNNDFSKANQILEMFDLADSEIATEVTFTEQLRHLVTKIKNIIYYRDDTRYPTKELSALSVVSTEVMGLVEGFLASNRSPNSFDIIDLASRHPHLQLYNHQNAPFINAVDILLSSGLNREITYGLINVVERKLAEVRCSTDIAAVKKTNYIRFVEDIASVTFEIFGNTEKSFDFVDNICGLIADCRVPIKHKEFCKLNQLCKELRQACEDLTDVIKPKLSENFDESLLQKYHQIYMNVVAASDKDVCNVSEVCRHGVKKTRMPYLRMCYMYCKTVSQLELEDSQLEDDGAALVSDLPYFAILERQLHDIFGKMIHGKNVPVTNLEPISKKLNVNLIPKLILTFCPSITLAGCHKEASEANFNSLLHVVYDFKNPEENLFLDPVADFSPAPRPPDSQCLTYVVLHNWVLAHIIKKIHTSPDENSLQQSMDARTKILNNYMELERFNCTKVLFGGNKYMASLHSNVDLDKLFPYMRQLVERGKILKCLNIIEALSERQRMCSANLANLRDLILFKLSTNTKISSSWKYCQYLKCPELKVDLVLNNLSSWPAEGALEVLDYLRFLLNQDILEEGLYKKCTDWMTKIPLYDQIASIIGESPCVRRHWYDIYEKSVQNPEEIIEVLLDSQQFKLCLEWADVQGVSENMKNLIIMNLLRQLFEYTNQATPGFVSELLHRLPEKQAMDIIQEEMSKVRNVEILQVCVDFISENSFDWKAFENIKIGLQIMLEIDVNMRNMFWDLIEKPLLMIEQFLMNAKLDILAVIINKIAPNLKKDPTGDNLYYNIKTIESLVISRNAVDALLRFYAEKALDMKNPRNSCPAPPRPSDDSLLQSIDSINIEAASMPFVMPEQVPSKQAWVEDYSTDRCMVCRTSIFSMIIRRHHCRRCGRLVCHACSTHRMQVPTYPSGVKFRVCDDCYTQSMNKRVSDHDNLMLSSNSDSAASGATCMDWCLSTSSSKNEAVRSEFSYEFIPNVTLCLTIMKMHSINLDYPRFLLDRSDEIARSLPGGDARLLVRARRSLLLAANELYSRTPHEKASARVAQTGAAHASRCLAHADALAALVRHQAHQLVHHAAPAGQIVRSLLEAEKWELALEIATKSGLPRTSVLAAWGKSCLKAGCFKQAREKFAHCFKNTVNVCVDIAEDCEYGKEASEFVNKKIRRLRYSEKSERSSSMSSVQSDGRPRTNPPLLNEIITLIEDMNYPVNHQLLQKAETIKTTNEKLTTMNTNKKKIRLIEPALNIMHTLASVKKIKQGDYSDFQTATIQPKKSLAQGLLRRNSHHPEPKTNHHLKRLDPFFFKECVYYLTNYGSHVANILFFMKHSTMGEVIRYCYDNMVDKETFTESVYMECLKRDKVSELLKAMSDMDSTLEMWADYIMHICRTLEKSKRLEALYAFQCGSSQHARASATCALLYARALAPQAPFAALQARLHHLSAALSHLAHCVPTLTKVNDPKSFQFHLDKATIDNLMTTISRQIELANYLAAAESSGRLNEKVVNEVIPLPHARKESESNDFRPLTLFGSNTDKMRLVAVVLATGASIEAGYDLAFKIITEHKLDSMNIYTHVAKYLVHADRFMEVKSLAKCIRASKETAANLMSDQVLEWGVSAVVSRCEARGQLHDEQAELLICDIHSVAVKISCYLVCRNVSNAYILAARHDRCNDLRRVLQEAERLGHDQVRNACLKRLTNKNLL
ncbi:zinc finger FYVE domain-containing protein 26 [Plodia interpunctella]|uniref:zinc finger FYVE domain-containing protein 26 n=1 Tax=Plodia interpunctella TaxID=58824 RepID=UPI002368BF58|nr:zinc finger FYVE domain-containing protein 26 [Plodia interpunctella]XP_053613987.1 zinc finger FYVE domain-containing protein 26 [Plodia interpunctella]XP_053613988.1 zinc finger FYVE domain-containing protein 26 [Plodia interpunctella]XP_053613989.1 zinc finger FYVE domain-containing protein 26 [Plodia interpunctella]XP_053613990.1 zinc finger FYVE domain-containing protein 26 [Plodia interpunctella]XP_053613991.1 zinc finger FYVE domain-containing protein 26 [Plodia interpunctella]XP_05